MFKNQKGFTLIEMLIVLMIISVLIILIVPNLGKKAQDVNTKGCEALISVVQTQIAAYTLDEGTPPVSVADLTSKNYITEEQETCPNGNTLSIGTDGKITDIEPTP